MTSPFTFKFRMRRIIPTAVLAQAAGMPLVRTRLGHNDLREDFVDAGRMPGLYLDGLHLAQMGGEPYSVWN